MILKSKKLVPKAELERRIINRNIYEPYAIHRYNVLQETLC